MSKIPQNGNTKDLNLITFQIVQRCSGQNIGSKATLYRVYDYSTAVCTTF